MKRNCSTAEHKFKAHKFKKGILALALAGGMSVMAACGEKGRVDTVKEWVYVPEFVEIKDEEFDYYDVQCSGDNLYYTSRTWDDATGGATEYLNRYSLADKSVTKLLLDWGDQEQSDKNLDEMSFAADGSICAMVRSYTYDETTQMGKSSYGLARFGADGKLMYFQDVTDKLMGEAQGNYVYITGIAADDKGRIYVASESGVALFEADGTYKGTISIGNGMESMIRAIGADRDGKVYACSYNYGGGSLVSELMEIDFDGQKTGTVYSDFPSGSNYEGLTPGAEAGTFLINDGSTLYEYNLAAQTKTALFDWLDSDINGDYVRNVGVAADGRIIAVINDWDSRENSGVALLTKTKGSEAVQKETILIGTLQNARGLQAAAVNFNRNSDKYHVTIKQYMDTGAISSDTYMTAYQDALTNMNNDLTSRANCPDVIDLSGLNISQLTSKKLLEDLDKYLDKSSLFGREDFVENILNCYTYDGVLVCIPTSVELSTIIGKTSEVGEKQGWTLQELIAYADQHPGASLFDHMSKNDMMQVLLAYNEELFIDWSKGKCNFDSDEFKNLLAFANRFPSEIPRDAYQISTPTRIQKGEVLLQMVDIYDFDRIQMYYEVFGGDITCKGYPSEDGGIGTVLQGSGLYGITTKGTRKEGAWEFLESYLQYDNDTYSWGFPVRKDKLDEMAKEAVTVEYWTDENGNPVLDENGDPIEIGVGGSIGYQDGWSYTYRKATQAEVDLILQLMDNAKPINLGIVQILELINDDAAGYFEGQKSVDEVAKVIQNRVQLYVDVNN